MRARARVRTAVVAGAATAVAVLPGTALATPADAAAGHGSRAYAVPTSTSWTSPRDGLTLAYPNNTSGSAPTMLSTIDGGRRWRKLPAPPVRYPVDHDTPQLVSTRDVIAVTNGTRLVRSIDSGRRWSRIRLSGIRLGAKSTITDLGVYRHRLLAIVTTSASASQTVRVYDGSDTGTRLTAVRGLSISGSYAYGDLTTTGGVQVAIGAANEHLKAWYSRDASHFRRAPLPCPAADTPFLAGIHSGRDVALCSAGESTVQPGTTTTQVFTARGLGRRFTASHPAVQTPNPLDVTAASATVVTIGSSPGLGQSFDGGQTYADEVPTGEGSSWQSMAFLSRTVGVAVDDTVTSDLTPIGHVYRTTDAGRHWTAQKL